MDSFGDEHQQVDGEGDCWTIGNMNSAWFYKKNKNYPSRHDTKTEEPATESSTLH